MADRPHNHHYHRQRQGRRRRRGAIARLDGAGSRSDQAALCDALDGAGDDLGPHSAGAGDTQVEALRVCLCLAADRRPVQGDDLVAAYVVGGNQVGGDADKPGVSVGGQRVGRSAVKAAAGRVAHALDLEESELRLVDLRAGVMAVGVAVGEVVEDELRCCASE